MKITAVVLNWRRPEETIACVRSVRETAHGTQIIVVDNASDDGSVEKIRGALPGLQVIENEENLGYAGGNNVGIREALDDDADAVIVLNNDVVVQPNCIQTLAHTVEQAPDWTFVGPVSLRADATDVVDFFTASIDMTYLGVTAHGRDDRVALPSEPVPSDYVTGSAIMASADTWSHVGPFDERFYLVWEDVDVALTAQRWTKRPCLVDPRAQVLHGRSVSFGGEGSPLYQYFYVRNSFLIVGKHAPWHRRRRMRALLERRYTGWLDKPETTPALRRAIELGLQHGLARRWGPPPDEVRAL